jgi:hypothetical protein
VDTFEIMLPYLSVDLVWLLRKSKEGDGFQGWHKDFFLGGRITKTIVVNLGSKERQKEDTPVSVLGRQANLKESSKSKELAEMRLQVLVVVITSDACESKKEIMRLKSDLQREDHGARY